jgi:PHD/YefM family antitoxin component YafN of YafNO toxin-antitoxin module
MNLTPQQIQSLDDGRPVAVTVQGREVVVLPRDVYERVGRCSTLIPRKRIRR